MANDRMYLVHKPTLIGIELASHLTGLWSHVREKGDMLNFYSMIGGDTPDDMFLWFEDSDEEYDYDEHLDNWIWRFKKVDNTKQEDQV